MARGPGPLTRPRPDTVVMPKRGKRLKFRAQDACSGRVKSLCGLEASQVPAVEALSGAGEPCDIIDSSGETDAQEESIHERTISRKKKSKRHRVLTFLVQKDCWEQTGTNVGIQLQVQKTVPKIKEQVYGRIAASHSVRRCSYQPGPGLLPTAGHHPQFHLYSNCHGNDIYPVYYQREHGHAASSSETGVPRLSCPWWSETAQ
uniref:Transmembrane protein 183A isoform X12 n=1 Tax=Cervus elaphus TaxID=9860 RepID=A0AAU7BBB1_CEREL